MRRDPDAKDGHVDGGDDGGGSPLEQTDGLLALGNDGDSVDDDLHEQLDLEDPEEEDEEEDRDTGLSAGKQNKLQR
jgi:hypothetical protein